MNLQVAGSPPKDHSMKLVKTLLALAVAGAAIGAQAESNINSGAAAGLSASAKLNFRVTIPRVIYLRVGTGTDYTPSTTVDDVLFTVAAGNVGTGTAVAGAPASIGVHVLSTGGNVTLSANGTSGGLAGPGGSIAWSQITGSSSNAALPHPSAIGNGVAGGAQTLTASSGVVKQSANWSFSYANAAAFQAGNYDGVVTYTAALP
jgi:hypothetical protein